MCDHSGKFMLANQSFKVLKDYSPIHEKKTEGKSFTKVESLYTFTYILLICPLRFSKLLGIGPVKLLKLRSLQGNYNDKLVKINGQNKSEQITLKIFICVKIPPKITMSRVPSLQGKKMSRLPFLMLPEEQVCKPRNYTTIRGVFMTLKRAVMKCFSLERIFMTLCF